ncbi:uncharacterized protein LOC130725254 [Lotus japonicus]|uniref:uncharacterized protein LOC130725254 n=1 Tax=Lotus japonicus TaxID=34305 RepID=UPI00258AF6DE|nr:uncharacterized protein LOC130725254 [Lotus japonicus]
MNTIPLTAVDQHWRRLTSTFAPDESQPVLGLSIAIELEVIAKMFEEANVSRRQTIKERLPEIAYPDQTPMCHPPNKLPTRGRPNEPKGSTRRIPCSWENVDAVLGSKQGSNSLAPQGKGRKTRSTKRKRIPSNQSAPKKRSKGIASKSAQLPPQHPKGKVYSTNYIYEVPEFLREYVIDIHNVEDDGNCGYRCISSLMGKGEQNWKQVRQDMIKELTLRQGVYHGMYGTDKHYEKVLQALHLAPNEFATEEKWLFVPDLSHIVATMYQVVFVTLSNRGGSTYFPLTGPVLHPSEHQIICLLLVNNNHWVKMLISTDFPLPTVNPQWIYHCTVEARGWQLPYLDRMALFNKLSREANIHKVDGGIINLAED